jgi:hypothetical protein
MRTVEQVGDFAGRVGAKRVELAPCKLSSLAERLNDGGLPDGEVTVSSGVGDNAVYDLGIPSVEVIVVPGTKMDFTGSLYRQRAVSVKFNFFCGAVGYVALGCDFSDGTRRGFSDAT